MYSGSAYSAAPYSAIALVYVAPPVAAFSGTPLSGIAPLSVTFTDSSTNTPTLWLWEKNDSSGYVTFSTSQNPTETFTTGTWSIRLTATNAGGSDGETKTDYLAVAAPLFPGRYRTFDAGYPSRAASAAVASRGIDAATPSRTLEASS